MESKAATHEEIWDDSALVDSWNEALEEYKVSGQHLPLLRPRASWPWRPQADIGPQKYHSIHARGGTVDDIIQDDAEAM